MTRRDYLQLVGAAAAAAPLARAADPDAGDADRERRMQWWHEARFGMFIHWGLYSVLGRHEWAMEQEGIPVAEYEQLAKQFKPKPNCRARLGPPGQTGRPEIHGDDHQAPRRLLQLRHQADQLLRRPSRVPAATW